MKKNNVLYVLFLAGSLCLTACGVEYRLVEVQALRPAARPVVFTDKNIAIFTSLYADGTPESYSLRNDSLTMNEVAVGMKETFEKSILFADYEAPVYNLYFYCDNDTCQHQIDSMYLQSLTDETGSHMFVIIDSLFIDPYQKLDRLFDANYGYYFYAKTAVPFDVMISLYDAVKKEFVQQAHFADTLVWDDTDFQQAEAIKAIPSLSESSYMAAYEIGRRYANLWLPYWENMRRFYIVPSGRDWQKAADAASAQDWVDAMSIWEKYTASDNNKFASYAAFNMALGCEMQGFYDLALEWLSFAQSKYYFGYTKGYMDLLQERKSDSKEIQWQLKK